MFNFRIRGMRVASHFGSGVGYGPYGAVGNERVESSGFRRETEKDRSFDTAIVLPSEASLEISLAGNVGK